MAGKQDILFIGIKDAARCTKNDVTGSGSLNKPLI